MTAGELLARYGTKMKDAWFCGNCGDNSRLGIPHNDWCFRKPIHWLAAKMSEPTCVDEVVWHDCGTVTARAALYSPPHGMHIAAMTYCRTCNAFHIADCPNATRGGTFSSSGTMPPNNQYTWIDTAPKHTEREIEQGKTLGRAIGRLG